jgi:hypothetical protein
MSIKQQVLALIELVENGKMLEAMATCRRRRAARYSARKALTA